MAGLLVIGPTKRDPSLIGIHEIRFLEIAVLEIGIPKITGIEGREIEIAVAEVAPIRINAAEVGVNDD
jgi:hypothetical protein